MNDKIVAKFLSGNASEKEITELNNWLKENPSNQTEFDQAKRLWETSASLKKDKSPDVENAWAEFKNLAENQSKSITVVTKYRRLRIAAAIAFFIVLGFVIKLYFTESNIVTPVMISNISPSVNQPESVDVMTEIVEADTLIVIPQAAKKKNRNKSLKHQWMKNSALVTLETGDSAKAFLLPDNSIVFLNANSKLEYLANFSKSNRRVSLVGEGYFEVKRDSGQFVVACENTVIRGRGTSFNIKSYEKDKEVEVIVAGGEVEFSGIGKKEFKKLVLTSGQTGIYKKESDVFVKDKSHRKNYKWWQKSFRAKIKSFFDKLLGKEQSNPTINPLK